MIDLRLGPAKRKTQYVPPLRWLANAQRARGGPPEAARVAAPCQPTGPVLRRSAEAQVTVRYLRSARGPPRSSRSADHQPRGLAPGMRPPRRPRSPRRCSGPRPTSRRTPSLGRLGYSFRGDRFIPPCRDISWCLLRPVRPRQTHTAATDWRPRPRPCQRTTARKNHRSTKNSCSSSSSQPHLSRPYDERPYLLRRLNGPQAAHHPTTAGRPRLIRRPCRTTRATPSRRDRLNRSRHDLRPPPQEVSHAVPVHRPPADPPA